MHVVEQLRIKRTEAHHHLLSRKRKLAELFAATTCTGEVQAPQTNQHYLLQLQAFQDANDLQKGRRFDESTLPPRSPIIYRPRRVSVQATKTNNTIATKDVRSSKVPAQRSQSGSNLAADLASQSSRRTDGTNGMQNGGDRKGKEHGSSTPEGGDHRAPTGLVGGTGLPSRKTQSPGPELPASVDKDVQATSNDDQNTLTLPNGQARSPASMVASTIPEPQSSPASTIGPDSSNTPGPTVVSPTTSLGGEDLSTGSAILDAARVTAQNKPADHPFSPEPVIASHTHKLSMSSVDVDNMDIDPSAAFDSPVQTSARQADLCKEQPPRVKPPIRINTQQDTAFARPQPFSNGALVETPSLLTSIDTPLKVPSITPVSAADSLKRATRISSGALQKKSVSEILSGTPKSGSPQVDSPISASARDAFASATSQFRQADRDRREKERSKLSTVVFAKPQRQPSDADYPEIAHKNGFELEKTKAEDRDYLYTLFESKAYASKNGNLSHLIQHAHKTVTTADHLVDYEYQAQCRVLKRLYQLQSADRWALRQRKRADEPARQTSHWDFLLDHAKWMRTDFREERKWKHAAAHALAEACAEWVASSPEERKLLQVQVRPVELTTENADSGDVDMEDNPAESHPTPDLLHSGEDDSVSDDIADPRDINFSAAPAEIFSLGASEFNFMADKTPAFDKLINELPLYEPVRIEPDLAKSNLAERLDARWKTDIVPVSRFATESLKVKEYKSPFRKSRYEYELEPSPTKKTEPLPPRETNVGLFMAENKHIRDRIHPGHSFRPPSEHPMPTQAFFETRASSQWTPSEDDELRKLVKDYSYNWSLISSCLTAKSLYSSSADRRTPWECFERWVGLEGMPADMAKTPYFRAYSGRIEAASRHLQAQLEEAQRRAGTNAPITARKRTNQPVRVDRKRAQRHLAMLDAMRKLAKKRETMRQKQQASAEMAAMRKTSEINTQQRPPLKKPSEWSAHKFEEDRKIAQRQELYRQQLIAHQRAATGQQRGPNGAVNGASNGAPQPNGPARAPNGTPIPMSNGHVAVANGTGRPHPSMLGGPNGIPIPSAMAGPKGIQAQVQANLRNGLANSPQQLRMQEQLIRQAQQNGNLPSNAALANSIAVAQWTDAAANGQPSPSANMGANAGSPRQGGVAQALSSGHVPVLAQIAANIKKSHPEMSDEAIQRAATQQLTNWQQQATAAAAGQAVARPRVNQAALNAALGAANAAAHAGNLAAAAAAGNGGYIQGQPMMTTEQLQQYNQRMRMQQAQQHAARGMAGQLPQNIINQMANSPVMNMARPGSQHSTQQGLSRSATPRDVNVTVPNGTSTSPNTNAGISTPAASGQQGQLPNQGSPPRPSSQQAMQT